MLPSSDKLYLLKIHLSLFITPKKIVQQNRKTFPQFVRVAMISLSSF